jgi:hypothetical protein
MYSGAGDTTQLVPGFPIRTPWDHSSVDSSPRPIAASHVLHRLLVPRHPPSALSNLTTKMLASTVQFSTNNHPHPPHHNTTPTPTRRPRDQFCSQSMDDHPEQPHPTPGRSGLFFQDSTGCLFGRHHQPHSRAFPPRRAVLATETVAGDNLPVSPPMSSPHPTRGGGVPVQPSLEAAP